MVLRSQPVIPAAGGGAGAGSAQYHTWVVRVAAAMPSP